MQRKIKKKQTIILTRYNNTCIKKKIGERIEKEKKIKKIRYKPRVSRVTQKPIN